MADEKLERLKLLYDYTKFHIGLYGTLMAGFIAILSFWSASLPFRYVLVLKVVIVLLLIAAMSGAIVASSILDIYENYHVWIPESGKTADLDDFWETPIGPFNWKVATAKRWWFIEHTSFWFAVITVVVSFLLKGRWGW